MDGAVLFDHHENEVLGFNSVIRSNVSVGVSFSETLITDVGRTNGSRTFDVFNGGCDGKVGKFSCGLMKIEDEKSVIQCSDRGAESDQGLVFELNDGAQIEQERENEGKVALSNEVQGVEDDVTEHKHENDVALANLSAVVDDDGVLKAADSIVVTKDDPGDFRVSDVATFELQDGFDLVVDLNSMKNTQDDSVPRELVFSNVNYRVSDLVWGKVWGHSWWPGQIYDPSVASVKAKRHRKGNCYLIAYFGDQTFAWNDVSMIKPFHKHFTEMEKQNDLKIFRHAVDCALEEASRRVEFGLSCPCMPGQASPKLKTILNANAATSFEPMELVNFVKSLAQSSLTEFDRLEFVSARAQLSAFYRSKGYSQLPEFAMLDRLFENDKEILPEREKHQCDGQINDQVLMKTYDGFSQKSEHIAWNTKQTGKTKKLLPRKKAGDNSILRHGRKRKAAHDTTYEYFHPSQITDDISTSQRRRKGKAAYDTSDVTSTEVAATSSMSTPTPVELCYDSHWTDRYFLM